MHYVSSRLLIYTYLLIYLVIYYSIANCLTLHNNDHTNNILFRCPAGHDRLDITEKELAEHQFHTIEAPQITCSLCSSVMALDIHISVKPYILSAIYLPFYPRSQPLDFELDKKEYPCTNNKINMFLFVF